MCSRASSVTIYQGQTIRLSYNRECGRGRRPHRHRRKRARILHRLRGHQQLHRGQHRPDARERRGDRGRRPAPPHLRRGARRRRRVPADRTVKQAFTVRVNGISRQLGSVTRVDGNADLLDIRNLVPPIYGGQAVTLSYDRTAAARRRAHRRVGQRARLVQRLRSRERVNAEQPSRRDANGARSLGGRRDTRLRPSGGLRPRDRDVLPFDCERREDP